ncbi:response regulator transcription factor [Bacillaceae bacterium W0354]
MTRQILIVDDEQSITTLIDYNLTKAGFKTDVVHDGEAAIRKLRDHSYDLMVLDLMLPKINGLEVCQRLRESNYSLPIIMLTAKGEESDKIAGLDFGADDYITKPFSPKELIARIKAVLRRTVQVDDTTILEVGGIKIIEDLYEVYKNDELVEFTKKEFELLLYLAKRKNKPCSRDVLLKDVWEFDFVGDTRIVDVHISHLRDKLEDNPKTPTLIKTVRGVGYKLEG